MTICFCVVVFGATQYVWVALGGVEAGEHNTLIVFETGVFVHWT